MKKALNLTLFVLLALYMATCGLFAFAEQEEATTPEVAAAQQALFDQAMADRQIKALSRQLVRDPNNEAAWNELLQRLPLSPLDMFRINMESQRIEYVIPREVYALHEKWLSLHPEVALASPMGQAFMALQGVIDPRAAVILAATVGTNMDLAATNYDGEVQLSVNKSNNNQMVASANSWGCTIMSVYGTTDGGSTWTSSCAPGGSTYGLTCPSGNIELGSDPAVYWNDSGTVFLNYMFMCCNSACQAGTGNPTSSLVVAKSTNVGATWSSFGVVINHLSSTSGGFDDKQFYIVDNTPTSPYYGRHYQCWDNNNNEQISWSTNGTTWNNVDTPKGASGDLDLGCEMAVGKNGTVHMIFDGLTCGSTCSAEKTYYTRSTNGGAAWSTPVLIKNHNVVSFHANAKTPAQNQRGINPFGSIDIDNSGGANDGTLYVSYTDSASTGTMAASDVYVSRSTDNGATWGAGVKVNDDSTSTAQFHPFLTVDQTNGNVIVGWHDARNDTTNNRKVDFYMSRSVDRGATFEANTKVSQPSTNFVGNTTISYSDENSTDNSGANPNNYGEYLGVDAHAGKAWMAWTDTRNYYPTAGANSARKEDVAFATVTFGAATPDFTVSAAPTSVTINQGSSGNSTITVGSLNSFNSAVSLTASGLPSGVTASFVPTSVTPPANGSGTSTLTLTASAGAATGTSTVTVTGTSGATTHTTTISLTVNIVDTTPPTTSITSPAAGATVSGTITISANASDNVGVTNVEFYYGTTLIGSDTTSPYSVSWNTTGVANGSYNLTSKAYDSAGNNTTSTAVNVTVNNVAGPPDLTATYNSTYKAPACPAGGKSCDSGASLLIGRATLGPEPNFPNTINSACADGTSGTFHSDESLDALKVATNDGTAFAGGKAVTVTITAWCYSSADSLDLYYSSSVPGSGSPAFTLIGTQACTAAGVRTFTAGYTLPSTGTTHVVRGNFRYQGSAGSCTTGAYDDHDDLVFGVTQTADTTPPTTSITSPTAGATVSGTVTVAANASDNVGVTNVEFYYGTTLIAADATSPYSVSWNTTGVANGSYNLTSKAYDAAGNNTTSAAVNVTVNNTAAPPDLTATYSTTYLTPACPAGGKSCDTGATLINGRGTMTSGNETNRPNTIASSCADGNSGTYHVDESIDRLKVATNDGTAFASGKAITITFTVYCYSSADKLDVYRTATAATPSWTLVGTQSCTAAGVRTFTATYTLPAGANQAVRGQFRYNGTAGTCTSGSYNDRDDLVFGVQ